jgi:hypothetical protein
MMMWCNGIQMTWWTIAPQRHIMTIILKPVIPFKIEVIKRAGSYCNIRESRNGSGSSSLAHPVTMCEFHQGIKRDKIFHQDMKEDKDFNEWTQRVVDVPQMHCTHRIFYELDAPKDYGETAVFWKYSHCTKFSKNACTPTK